MTSHLWEGDALVVYQDYSGASSISDVLNSDVPRAFGRRIGRVFQLMHLWVPEPHRNRGIGSHLLCTIHNHCANIGVRRIDTDDMSDRFTHPQNVYLKHGFVYRQLGRPEMYVSVRIRSL